MLSKSQIKLITSLKQKKYRLQHGFFVVEGVKTITELIHSDFELVTLYTTESFNFDDTEEEIISETDLKRISFLKRPIRHLLFLRYQIQKALI
jgi:TrmH family RNA methyltransferase